MYKFLFIIIIFNISTFATDTFFSISVCTTSTKDGANNCKNKILKFTKEDTFILKDEKDKKFRTYIGYFNTYLEAKLFLKNSSSFIKNQQPFIKKLTKKSDKPIPKLPNDLNDEYIKLVEQFYLKESQKTQSNKLSKKKDNFNKIKNFDELIVEVDSNKNIMFLKGKNNNKLVNIKSYNVSTAKDNIKKPLGIGTITAISFEPKWYPTLNTLKAFKQKGINLPTIVPYGHKLNYMGAAKINLSHRVEGQEVYRIHGTLNENTIGTNESSGCIRMKNNEVVQLASILNEFSNLKSFNNIKVILK
uniref:L,D-transpeptidase n=1 Tax=Aliarcobacter sp. TaxID=2321116 RepID=UPI0040487FB8